jgi:hypothetical protein
VFLRIKFIKFLTFSLVPVLTDLFALSFFLESFPACLSENETTLLQPIEDLSSTEKSLKVPRSGTFKLFSEFHVGAKRCISLAGRE